MQVLVLTSSAVPLCVCSLSLTVTNGLRQPTQPSASNGGTQIAFSYYISDGATYAVQANLTLTATSAFASIKDQLGNPYQIITNVRGSRVYTYLPTGQQLTSTVTGISAATLKAVDQRFFPYALISSGPGVYTPNSVPYVDFDGVGFTVNPPVPANGLPVSTTSTSATVSVYVNGFTPVTTSPALSEFTTTAGNTPLATLQTQTYTFSS